MELAPVKLSQTLGNGEPLTQAPAVTLFIEVHNGVMVEVRSEVGYKPTVKRTVFTVPSEADHQAVIDATTY